MFKLKELLQIGAEKIIGDPETEIKHLVELKNYIQANENLTWCNDKNILKLKEIKTGSVICSPLILNEAFNPSVNYIIAPQPRKLFREVLLKYFYEPPAKGIISPICYVHPTANIGKNVSIGNYTTIEANCVIGDNCVIGNNNVILKDTFIHENVFIGNNNTIGGVGFGYEKDEAGLFKLVPHIGNVVIYKDVEIGNNTCIDKAVLGSTIINQNCKIDNLVHVAHNVSIGANSVIIANSLIGGSVVIGENCWVAPSSSIINGITVGEDSLVGLGAVVIRAVSAQSVMVGNPAKNIKKNNE